MNGLAWLAIAIVAEVIATTALKAADGFVRLGPSLITVVGYVVAFWCMSHAIRTVPVGLAYAIWSGAGIILITAIAWVLYKQALDAPALIGIGLILAGVLVINVAGTADSFQFNPGTFSVDAQTTVIWNFYQATSLSITGQFDGSILAPYANLTNNTQINGSVVAAGFNQGGEIHMANFSGVVPEPATWAMLLTGFFGTGALIRRTRRQMRAA